MKPILIIAAVLALALSACGAKTVPTIDPAQVQASAVAAASTMVALTQQAMPTETPVPPTDTPTDTPQPTPTIPPLPTSLVLASPTTGSSSSSGECSGPISVSKGDKLAAFKVNNKTKQLVTISFQLKKNAFGDCGYWSSTISASNSLFVSSLPLGCYNIYAFNQSGKPDWQNGYFGLCTGFNTDKFTINLSVTTVSVVAP